MQKIAQERRKGNVEMRRKKNKKLLDFFNIPFFHFSLKFLHISLIIITIFTEF